MANDDPRDQFVFFWGGEFSQWYKSPIQIDGHEYNCCEQYMMYSKAVIFKDYEAAVNILKTNSPSKQKSIGRAVKHFDLIEWGAVARLIVYRANLAKFTQNIKLQRILLETGNKHIVEASPDDIIWGVGLLESDPDIVFPEKWKGTNWLGEALMQVRSDIRQMNKVKPCGE